MNLFKQIKKRYFSGISVKLFLIAKISISVFILLSIYPQSLAVDFLDQKISLIPIVAIGLILIISYSYNKMLAKPLIKINEKVAKIAKLDFSEKCDVKSNDELGQLSDNLNLISHKLNSTISRLETELGSKAKLLKVQRELADVLSHEMKTPLGIIKAYVEGLRDNISPQKQGEYIDTILMETDRMNELITDLLNLSAMETGARPLDVNSFDLVELVEETAGRILIDSSQRNYDILCDFGAKSLYVEADRKKMEQVLINLISNADKNVADNGEIRLTVQKNSQYILIEIYNSGQLIPEDKILHIWDKFYRVDKSRDKKTGGSGLGLATVAQILSMHQFTYGAKNQNAGVTFYILIPI